MKLLCDEMLGGLARWLRAAGHDAAVAERGLKDAALIDRSAEEGRILVSRDRRLAHEASGRARAVLLATDDLDRQAAHLSRALRLDWTSAPFTRCLVDNTPLRAATEAGLGRIPERSRARAGPFRACPSCGRVFWPGSHVRRMLHRLEAWRGGGGAGDDGPSDS
jgi:uncharacterized protein with PIN domain